MNPLLAAHRHTMNNQRELEASQRCGCCMCLEIFPAQDIVAWSGLDMSNFDNPDAAGSGTGLCPHCGSEALIGDASGYPMDRGFLNKMSEAWFQKTMIRRPAPKKPTP